MSFFPPKYIPQSRFHCLRTIVTMYNLLLRHPVMKRNNALRVKKQDQYYFCKWRCHAKFLRWRQAFVVYLKMYIFISFWLPFSFYFCVHALRVEGNVMFTITRPVFVLKRFNDGVCY
jgi:hypothetical protein